MTIGISWKQCLVCKSSSMLRNNAVEDNRSWNLSRNIVANTVNDISSGEAPKKWRTQRFDEGIWTDGNLEYEIDYG